MNGTKSMNKYLNFSLDPNGVHFLEKRLMAGEISPHVFKDILKHQMVKQYFQDYVHPLDRVWERVTDFTKTRFHSIRKSAPFMEEPGSAIELEDLLSRAHHKRF